MKKHSKNYSELSVPQKLLPLNIISKTIDSLLSALGVLALGIPSAASVFMFKIACFYHDKKSLNDLNKIVNEIAREAKRAKERGTLVDFENEQNQFKLFQKIEDYLSAKYSLKQDLLRRIALHGIIKNNLSDEAERNLKYAIETIEVEDIEALENIVKNAMPSTEDLLPGNFDEHLRPFVAIEKLGENANFKCARLQSAGLITFVQTKKGKIGFRCTREGKIFLDYLNNIG